jgi:hypothetical protein
VHGKAEKGATKVMRDGLFRGKIIGSQTGHAELEVIGNIFDNKDLVEVYDEN